MSWEPIKIIAACLLVLRVVSVAFMFLVLRRQWEIMKQPIDPSAKHIRLILFGMAMVIFVGQFVPILIDTATLLADVRRNAPSLLGVAYAFSNATTAVVSSVLFWLMYRLIARENIKLEHERGKNVDLNARNDILQGENDRLQ